MKMTKWSQVVSRCALPVLALAGLTWSQPGVSESLGVPGLDYPLNAKEVRNPWLTLAAGGWPAMTPEEISKRATQPTAGEKAHLRKWLTGGIKEQWRPKSLDDVPFLAGLGFVHVGENIDYRVRIREANRRVSEGLPILARAIVVAVEPLGARIDLPQSQDEFAALLV
ncbi:MAG TPA: hypothetical protein VM221_06125 [Armatimonadota bacterium]|nr:hypothetical protein [Armatimonadota bacterium]